MLSLWNGFVSWSFWLLCPSLLSCKMEKSICVDSGLKGRWLCKQNPMLQMCLLNCHMCGVAGQNDITCWGRTWNIFKCDPVQKGQDSEKLCKITKLAKHHLLCGVNQSHVHGSPMWIFNVLGQMVQVYYKNPKFEFCENFLSPPIIMWTAPQNVCTTLEDLFVYLWWSIIVMAMAVATVKGFRIAHSCKV